jgi:hypothetical protein
LSHTPSPPRFDLVNLSKIVAQILGVAISIFTFYLFYQDFIGRGKPLEGEMMFMFFIGLAASLPACLFPNNLISAYYSLLSIPAGAIGFVFGVLWLLPWLFSLMVIGGTGNGGSDEFFFYFLSLPLYCAAPAGIGFLTMMRIKEG